MLCDGWEGARREQAQNSCYLRSTLVQPRSFYIGSTSWQGERLISISRSQLTHPCGGYGGDLNVGASAELLPGLEGRVLRALLVILGPDLHVGAGVLVDFAEGRVERDERKEDVAEGGVLQEGHFLRQRVSPRRKAHLDLKQVNKSICTATASGVHLTT